VESGLTIYFLNAGDADCILLHTQNHLVMIDCGEEDDGDNALRALDTLGVDRVDCMILTHPDKDHIGGAPRVLSSGRVDAVYLPDYDKGSEEQRKLRSAIASTPQTESITVKRTMRFVLDGVTFTVYATALPLKGSDASNMSSLGVLVEHGNNRLFFAGDAVGARIPEIISQIPDPSTVDLLKIPHHGRFDNQSDALIEALTPSVAIICCDRDAPPDNRVLHLLNSIGADQYQTAHGIIAVTSDGEPRPAGPNADLPLVQARAVVTALGGRLTGDDPSSLTVLLPRR
jgi:beta-lactamase superfamily II metal-dependent hydrolase